jgi:hypothetical protein
MKNFNLRVQLCSLTINLVVQGSRRNSFVLFLISGYNSICCIFLIVLVLSWHDFPLCVFHVVCNNHAGNTQDEGGLNFLLVLMLNMHDVILPLSHIHSKAWYLIKNMDNSVFTYYFDTNLLYPNSISFFFDNC